MKRIFILNLASVAAAFALCALGPNPAQAQAWGDIFTGIQENTDNTFTTCSRLVTYKCHESIQSWVRDEEDEINGLYVALALPPQSNGADEAAYNWLTENIETEGEDSVHFRVRERIFPEGVQSARQVTRVDPLLLSSIFDIENHQVATQVNRDEIVELQNAVNSYGETLDLMSSTIGDVTGALALIGGAVEENRKGIALAYALSNVPSTISSNSRGAVAGGIGHFEDENAVAFGLTFRFAPRLTGNVAGGFDSGDGSSVSGGRAGLVWEFGSFGN